MNAEEKREYYRKYYKKWTQEHKQRNRDYQKVYYKKKKDKLKKELAKVKEKLKSLPLVNEIIREIRPNVYKNMTNDNIATLYQNSVGQWWYQIEYSTERMTYISEMFDKRHLAIADMRVAI